ncbi:hypothetical protein OKW21_004349 [Catalinimonas alkaloidigena]|uniref:hypothetical protein n=1 Tax=Catalinimonas TaxID=1522128 RepID=UPI002405F013|nr:hypothetical protein [Catalinimonas alkaloidigena]MDF9799086.1 hypothetical protein [Catalinimonas alkaloidigena]
MIVSYELNIIHQVVQGSLSPLYFPTEPSEQARFYKHLSEVPKTCARQIHARFGQSEDQSLSVESLDIKLLDRYRPPVFVALNHKVQVYEQQAGEVLLDMVLQRLSLASESIIEWYHWQDESGSVHLELYAYYPLDSLSFEERRYHFYQKLLIEQVALVQQKMLNYTFQAASKDVAQKYVQDHQQTLITYARHLMEQLGDTDLLMYTFSGEYSLPDISKHIFLGLQELIGFIEKQFAQYIDIHAAVPYHDHIQILNHLSGQLNTVQNALAQSEVDPSLHGILSGFFVKIKGLAHQKASYLQLRKYQQLLQGLEKIVNERHFNEEELTTVLISHNFDDESFVGWFIDRLKVKLDIQQTKSEKLGILYYYQKFCKQLPVQYSLQTENISANERILGWLREEIAYLEKYPSLVSEPLLTINDEKVKTNLSVAQVSLLIKLFLEVDLFPEQNQNNIYRRFSEILSSTQQEEVSAKSLKAKFYQHDQHTISILKDKVIAMLNYLNKIS